MFHPIRNYEETNDMLPMFSHFLSKNCKIISVLFTAFFNNKKKHSGTNKVTKYHNTTKKKSPIKKTLYCITFCSFVQTIETKRFLQFEIIINGLLCSFRFIWIPMLWVYDQYKYFYSFSARIDFRRYNLTYTDVRFWRLKSIPALQGWDYKQIKYFCNMSAKLHLIYLLLADDLIFFRICWGITKAINYHVYPTMVYRQEIVSIAHLLGSKSWHSDACDFRSSEPCGGRCDLRSSEPCGGRWHCHSIVLIFHERYRSVCGNFYVDAILKAEQYKYLGVM